MSKQRLFKFSKLKIALIIFILIAVFEGIVINKLSKEKKTLNESFSRLCDDYDKSIKTHPFTVKIKNFDRDLHNVILEYKTFTYKTIPIGDLVALDINLKDPVAKKKNDESSVATIDIDDMASPVYFELTGTRKDGTIFKSNISGFDIQCKNEIFEVYIDADQKELRYH